MTNTPANSASTVSVNVNFAAAALWASAFVILALIIIQAGRLPGTSANAAVQADRGSYTIMTADSGKGGDTEPDEILCVLDSREQILMVYEIEDARRGGMMLRDGYALSDLFLKARR
ncbi:MAG TPA: hypothetical protein VMS30_07405 [Phycisphaerales bacterium]|nr:hypothetical protein [Phycisphaerales bacterium]